MRMINISLACYKGKGSLYDYIATTLLHYSHIEICINSYCYSSSLRDGGVRVKQINFNPNNWDRYYLGTTKTQNYIDFNDFFENVKNCEYDKLSLYLNLLGIKKDTDNNKFTCYEFVAKAFNILFNANIDTNLLPYKLQKGIRNWK